MTRPLVGLLALLIAVPAVAQGPVVIDPGLSTEQVVARLGPPSGESHSGARTYLSFDNGCGKSCGGDDIVIFDNDAVVDAVFHTGRRVYAGAGKTTTLAGTTSKRPAPDPIRPASPGDSTHRGGIVFMGPRPPATQPKYTIVKPNHADSASMAAAPKADSSSSPTAPHRE
jgi:hypothetical protein